MRRTMCGTTRPTNPMTPLTATATPASSEVAKNRFRRSRATSTPRDAAGSAPMASAFSDRAWRQQVDHDGGQGDHRDRQLIPVGQPERAQQPEQHRLGRLRVAAEDQEARHRLEHRRQHHAAQDQLGRGELPALPRHQEHRGHRHQRPQHAAHRDRPDPQRRERPEQQHRGRADAGAGGHAEQERVGQRVAHQHLHDRPGGGQGRADHGGQQHARQPDLPDDGRRPRCFRVTGQMAGDDLPDRGRAQRHRSDAHARPSS